MDNMGLKAARRVTFLGTHAPIEHKWFRLIVWNSNIAKKQTSSQRGFNRAKLSAILVKTLILDCFIGVNDEPVVKSDKNSVKSSQSDEQIWATVSGHDIVSSCKE